MHNNNNYILKTAFYSLIVQVIIGIIGIYGIFKLFLVLI